MKIALLSLALFTIAFVSQAAETTKTKAANQSSVEGVASYYATRYDGRITASGQHFSSTALTAASLTIPMGSRVKVTNLANNHSVIVRINDKGPFVKGRDISVTHRAAKRLGFLKAGIAKVRITRLS